MTTTSARAISAALPLLAVVVLVVGGGCAKDKPITDVTSCPCAPGWTCDPVADLCVPDGVGGASGAGAPVGAGGNGGGAAGTNPSGVAGQAGVAVCGNGVRDPGEACDDGNTRGADGCTAACAVEDGFVCNVGDASACNRSCANLTGTECQGDDCCASPIVPGGTISYNNHAVRVPSFRLDKYEVTAVRLHAFLEHVDAWQAAGNPVAGAGAHPDVPASGWRPSWLKEAIPNGIAGGLEPMAAIDARPRSPASPVYAAPGSGSLAVNWVPWHIAFAFCIWDGGRLPADIEWTYAAFRGEEQSLFPWGNSPSLKEMLTPVPASAAIPFYDYPGQTDEHWWAVTIPVGSHPASGGRFGHQDLMAGLSEMVRDTGYSSGDDGFIQLGTNDQGTDTLVGGHKSRGGDWLAPSNGGTSNLRSLPAGGLIGFRCARDVR
jgi:sulfatase modifying factor 1